MIFIMWESAALNFMYIDMNHCYAHWRWISTVLWPVN